MEQAKMERGLAAWTKRREMPDETFFNEDEQVMTYESAEADNLFPSFQGRRKKH